MGGWRLTAQAAWRHGRVLSQPRAWKRFRQFRSSPLQLELCNSASSPENNDSDLHRHITRHHRSWNSSLHDPQNTPPTHQSLPSISARSAVGAGPTRPTGAWINRPDTPLSDVARFPPGRVGQPTRQPPTPRPRSDFEYHPCRRHKKTLVSRILLPRRRTVSSIPTARCAMVSDVDLLHPASVAPPDPRAKARWRSTVTRWCGMSPPHRV